ncbi:methyl-accepting chemotaxis protein, putative [Candidatus Moduliflexus flocculans]|uniref:Methyl-accepting chemotaxis protein, putative n=1 Tax=Candidatus Moduliflexus flocculans TaxID=1499966 RepID=A0A0S6W3M2_9BACT|nr:methyl-accepting chemotaxis protein, putative [Candidatus Moduliflexus flocculans]
MPRQPLFPKNWLPSVFYVSDMNTMTSDFRIAENQHILSLVDAEMSHYEEVMQKLLAKIEEHRKAYEPLILSDEERKVYEEFTANLEAYLKENKKLLAMSRLNQTEEAKTMIRGDSQKFYDELSNNLLQLVEINTKGADLASQDADKLYLTSRFLTITVIVIAMIAGLGLGLGITSGILNQLGADPSEVSGIAKEVAEGNLAITFDSRGKAAKGLLASILNMVDRLRDVVSDVQGAAENVSAGSETLSSGAEEMSQGAGEQAAAAEEASSSMEQMAANIRQNAENATQTEKIATKAANDAIKGGEAVAQTVTAMREIVRKITIIEEIARQTHTLSLNATIEAAKAQEYGKGFAVVAAEVRALASRSQDASSEINQMASQSIEIAERAGDMLSKLVPDIQKTAELVQEIGAASREQSSGTEQINRAIQQLDTVIQQNSSVSEEMAATSEELAGQAEQLQHAIAFFRIGETEPTIKRGQTPRKKAEIAHLRDRRKFKSPHEKANGKREVSEKTADQTEVSGDHLDEEFERY